MDEPFARAYPHLTRWIDEIGWIELGFDGMQPSHVRVLDEGGLIGEGGEAGGPIDAMLREAETAIGRWIEEEMGG